jgi:L-alanine-DL-glutamate epimerase-like enolase superfamily enzyme
MRRLFAILEDELPSGVGLVVDANFGWRTPAEALGDIAAWRPPRLAWLEDPLLPEEVVACARIRRDSGQRVGVGDEVTDPTLFDRLIDADAIDVLRLDVVAIGGITPARKIERMARERGLPVSCHVYPEIAVHLGADVETFHRGDPRNPYDPLPAIIAAGPEFRAGEAIPSGNAGLGFELRPELDPSALTVSEGGGR